MRFRSRPNHATVVAYLALFVALGGTTYAATGGNFILGQSNSADAVTSLARTGANAGKGLQVSNTSTTTGATALGLNVASGHAPFTVNSGTKVANLNADELDGLNSTAFARNGSEAWHEVQPAESPEPAFNANNSCGWRNFDPTGHSTAAFLRDRFGFVHLKGIVKAVEATQPPTVCDFGTNSPDRRIFSLPAGYRPAKRSLFATITNNALGRVNVDGPAAGEGYGAGAVFVDSPTTVANAKVFLGLDGISFRCAPSGSNGCP
jgi:hypothetical protein